ncbi:MAG: fluoride efflux transporter CrcB [Chitinophagales bacterium]|nr:fluoride efflux transporter CrcB [Chitinophagales bacterium]
MIWKNILLVAFGGGLGSSIRYLIYVAIKQRNFPYDTITVNVLGSLIIGAIMAFFIKQNHSSEHWKLFFITGFLGGFTTFSAFSWDTLHLFQQQRYSTALLYVGFTFLLTLIAVFVGFKLVK